MMRRALTFLLLAPLLLCLGAFLLLAGCGSSNSSDYEREVSEINRVTSEKLEESLHLLAEEGHVEQEAHTEEEAEGEEEGHAGLVVKALEEAVMILKEALLELEEVKVPAGMEDHHRQLISFYSANLAAYEGYLAALAPGEEHAEGEIHEAEESAETHEEDTGQEEEAPGQEEAPAESGGH